MIGPTIEARIPKHSFARSQSMGHHRAVECLAKTLKMLGPDRYALKRDVKQYFASISHDIEARKPRAECIHHADRGITEDGKIQTRNITPLTSLQMRSSFQRDIVEFT